MKLEVFKDIPNYESKYQVSNLGRVKSLPRKKFNGKGYHLTKEKILKTSVNPKARRAYEIVSLAGECRTVHSLVAECFLNHNALDRKLVVHHIDNNPLNNNLDNLEIITHRENISISKKGSSKYTGVSFAKDRNKWRAKITINKQQINLGAFETEELANLAYQQKLNTIL